MRTVFLLILGILFFWSEPYFAQNENDEEELTAENHIARLKNGKLLVRLKTMQNTVLMLEARGLQEDADEIWENQIKENRAIAKAFELFFDFCPVYFFYDENSEAVKSGDYEDYILNYDLDTIVAELLPAFNYVYFADFGEVHFKHFNQHMQGAVILDQFMMMLPGKFPSIVRKRAGVSIIKRTNADLVQEMNEKLHKFYSRHAD